MTDSELANAVLATARDMNRCGINRGSAGNVSARGIANASTFIITPTGMAYDQCSGADMVQVCMASDQEDVPTCSAPLDKRLPSSEWRFHHDIYRMRPEAGAIVHTHSPFATALACQHMDVPAFHYMVARFGGDSVPCARYETFGTQALSDAITEALRARNACLMAHHGMVVVGRTLEQALALAVELETLCEQYWRVWQLGPVKLLPADEMQRVLAKFSGYGQQR